MISNTFFLGLVIILKVYANSRTSSEDEQSDYGTRVINARERANREELVKIIQNLNRIADDDAPSHEIIPNNHYGAQENVDVEEASNSGDRFHILRNPEIVQEFIGNLRGLKSSSTSEDNSNSSDRSDDRRMGDDKYIRRNVEFRIGSSEERYEDKPKVNHERNYIPESLKEQITPFQPHFIERTSPDDKIDSGYWNEETRKDVPKRSNAQDEIIEKDIWKATENEANEAQRYDLDKVTKNIWDDIRKEEYSDKDGSRDRSRKRTSKSDWDKPARSKWDESIETTKKWVVVKPKKASKKKDFNRSRKQKDLVDKLELDWNKKNKDVFDDPKPYTEKKEKIWDAPKPKKQDDDWKQPKKIVDNDWDKVGREWSQKNKDKWAEPQKTSRSSWKKKKKNLNYEKPSYVARVPEYHSGRDRVNSFQGRTPIPFIGRQGIYET